MADSSGGWISLGFFLVVAMIITGPLVGVYVVKPVLRVQHFKEAVCTNQRFEYAGFDETCSCGEHCSSSYPCYRVYVKYVDEVNDVEHDNVYVVENEQTLVHNRDVRWNTLKNHNTGSVWCEPEALRPSDSL
eukprot:m.51432 g.51432  ORF g.51432 m.51432 type:complete len:132 (+) comp34140_c0_seq2:42-437(+)